MGSFDISCAISKLSVGYGDKVGLLPIVKDPYAYDSHLSYTGTKEPGTSVILHTGYKAFCPPIYGTYDDYGYLTNIKPSPVTKYLENITGKTIEEVAKCISNRRGVYDDYSEIFKTFAPEGFEPKSENDLTSCGFVQDPENVKVFLFQGYALDTEKRTITTPNGNVKNISRGTVHGTSLLQSFGDITGVWPGFEEKDWEAITLLYGLGGQHFLPKIVNSIVEHLDTSDDYFYTSGKDRLKTAWDKTGETFANRKPEDIILGFHVPMTEIMRDFWASPYAHEFEDYFNQVGYEPTLELYKLNAVYDATLTLVYPGVYGQQGGNDEAMLALNKASQKIIKKRLKEYGE